MACSGTTRTVGLAASHSSIGSDSTMGKRWRWATCWLTEQIPLCSSLICMWWDVRSGCGLCYSLSSIHSSTWRLHSCMGFLAASTSEWANEAWFDLLRKHFSIFSFGAKGIYPILNWTDEPLRALLMSALLLIGLTTTHLTIQASHYIRIRIAHFIDSWKLSLIKSEVIWWYSRSTRWHLKLSWIISDGLIQLVLPKSHKRRMCCARNSRRHHR